MVYMDFTQLTQKKNKLNQFRPLDKDLVKNLEDWFRVELTYTSNAIEGNTLNRRETALVVEKSLTVGGKTLVEHLEATNHAKAIDWVQDKVQKKSTRISEKDVLKIHEIILRDLWIYAKETISRIKKIHRLKKERLSLEEIKQKIKEKK